MMPANLPPALKAKASPPNCIDCGCDRGGVINLEESKNPPLRCFQCYPKFAAGRPDAQRGTR
jgi:hypothetical protein